MKIHKCKTCGKEFDKGYKLGGHITNRHKSFIRGIGKYHLDLKEQLYKKRTEYLLNPTKCLQCGKGLPYEKKTGYKFCGHVCSAKHSNIHGIRPSTKGKTKTLKCNICGIDCSVSIHSPIEDVKCHECRQKIHDIYLKNNPTITVKQLKNNIEEITTECTICGKTFYKLKKNKRKTCSNSCSIALINEATKNPTKFRTYISRRSKNEIHFAELCKTFYKDVLTNKPIFNGWDTDVILPHEKIAILWNGIWHHKKMKVEHSLELTQSNDKIRIQEITDVGFIPYIIDDFGGEDPKFVLEKFEEFKQKHPPIL